jgi:hypothetical protein
MQLTRRAFVTSTTAAYRDNGLIPSGTAIRQLRMEMHCRFRKIALVAAVPDAKPHCTSLLRPRTQGDHFENST